MTEKIIPLKTFEEKTQSGNVLLWTCIGPIMLLLALLAVSLMKADLPIYLGCLAASTLVLIFFWELKGMLLGWALESAFIIYTISNADTFEGPFLLFSGISFCLSHVIFLLGTYEAKSLVETLEVESKSRLSALWKLEEKSRLEEKNFEQERAKFGKGGDGDARLKQDFEALKKEKEELTAALLKMNTEKVERLDQGAEEITLLKKELEEALSQLDGREKEELRLRSIHGEMSTEIERLHREQEVLTDALIKGEELASKKDEEIILLETRIEELTMESKEQSTSEESYKEKEFLLRGLLQEANAKITQLERNKEVVVKAEEAPEESKKEQSKLRSALAEVKNLRKEDAKKIKELQGKYKQLQQQFDKKSESLDDSRKALFHMQEKLFTLQRDAEEPNSRSEIETMLEEQIRKMEEERKSLLKEHHEEVESLQDVIETLLQKN